MSAKDSSITPMYSSNKVYNTSLLSSIYIYRVLVRDPLGKGIYPISPEEDKHWFSAIEILIEAPTVLIAIMTARDLGYDVTHVQCMHHD